MAQKYVILFTHYQTRPEAGLFLSAYVGVFMCLCRLSLAINRVPDGNNAKELVLLRPQLACLYDA